MRTLTVAALIVAALAYGAYHAIQTGWVDDQRARTQAIHDAGVWVPTPQPGITYHQAVRVEDQR